METPPVSTVVTPLVTPLVTVVVLCRNSEKTIHEALASLVTQTFRNIEILVVDGGSSDNSLSIVQSFQDPRIRIIPQSGRGLVDARNLGIASSQCEFVAYLDSDDVAKPDRLQKQYEFLLAHPEYAVVGCWLELIDGAGASIAVRKYASSDEDIRFAMGSFNPLPNPGIMFRKSAVIAAGQYHDILPEDYDLWFRLLQHGKFHNIPEVLTQYRVHLEGSKAQTPKLQLKWSLELRWKYWKSGFLKVTPRMLLNNLIQIALLVLPAKLLLEGFKWSVKRKKI